NDGGDGLLVAEALCEAGPPDVAVWLYRRDGIGAAPVGANLLDRVHVVRDGDDFAATLARTDLIVDALYGIGARAGLPDDLAAALVAVNERGQERRTLRVALDIPTGVDADTGAADPAAFHADLTVTLGRPKRGLFLPHGLRFAGEIVVDTLDLGEPGVPDDAPRLIGREDAARLLPRREADAHKSDAGALMIVGGSANYFGATTLAGNAALRAGVGLLTLAVPRGILNAVAAQIAEATFIPLPESEWGVIGASERSDLTAEIAAWLAGGRYTALQIGNGIGRNAATLEALNGFFGLGSSRPVTQQGEPAPPGGGPLSMPILFDADGLYWLTTVEGWWDRLRGLDLVLTPHPGEMARLRGVAPREVAAAPWEHAREAARQWGQTVVLKSGHTTVATPEGALWVAPVANPALATAGTGDTLAGTIGGLLAQGLSPADAAILGLWLGSRAGELARTEVGTLPLVASDLPRYLGRAIKELESAED
ncbi:MAG: NAD(P)H-hydrate epimerase / ADP-dependent (S)-NAD(P)H-hydrate dehydratase, partial [uncultured Thermomicrobiales bacterium]